VEEMIHIRRSEYEQLISEQKDLQELVRQLRGEIELLKNGRNSKTSSTAPSHDIHRSNVQSLRKNSGKPSGGQKGHPGHTLSMSSTPDTITDHFPERCTCGCSLEDVIESGHTRRQAVDIPPVKPEYTEHRFHHKICLSCGSFNTGHYPAGVNARIQYCPNVKSTVSYMSIYRYLPYKRIVRFFKDTFSLSLSEGSIDSIPEEMSQKSEVAYQAIRERIIQSEVIGPDETDCRVNGKKHWFHVWQNSILTFIVSFTSRGYKVMEEYFPAGFLHSFYVSDCRASQLKAKAKAHQLCTAHLLRELLNFEKSLQDTWSVKMKELIYRAIALKRTMLAEDYQNPPEEVAKLNSELDELLAADISGFHRKEQAFINRLKNTGKVSLLSLYIQMSRRIITARKEQFEMSKSKRKSQVSSVIRKEKALIDLQGFARLLILLSKMGRMCSCL
jgi:transposase